eukprot:CAMPEP_0197460070 /NCGR_PEP_ID=MMETSP1175-20131217/53176_1 /TAXON_ID=1003142 /ORGANISM="Triceratium dubium, Strain CCMP147" /LENGTH=133 /DNA_ID=CAMNT_0042995097 /DNA_START=97 /DNA_END=498 /DNA_ORIENTATION=+
MSIRPSTLPPVQDMPPEGGFRKLDFKRIIPERGPKGWQIWMAASFSIMYGFYQIGKTNTARNQQKLQERKVRYALAPVLQAEADREYLERELINLKKEAEVMKGVPGWEVGKNPYFSGKWMPRAVSHMDRSIK